MTAPETASDPAAPPPPLPLRSPGEPVGPVVDSGDDAPVGHRRYVFALCFLGLALLVGGVTPLVGGAENVVAARMGFAILLLCVGLTLLARRPSLAVGGLGALLGLFLHANPFYGDRSAEWPWRQWLSGGALDQQVDVAIWVGAAALCLVRAYLGRGRWILFAALLLALLALVRTHAQGGGMPLLRNEEHLDLTWSLTIASLGTSALLFARGSARGRGTAVTLAVLGAVLAATIYLAWFPPSTGLSMAQHYYLRAMRCWDTLVTSADASPSVREGVLKDVLGKIAPFWCMAASLPVLFLASLFPRPSRASRVLGSVAFGLLLLRWLVPAYSLLYFQREFLTIRGPSIVSSIIGDALTGAGLASWLLLSASACLAFSGGLSLPSRSPLRGEGSAPRAVTRVPYVVVLLLLLVALRAAYNPDSGTVAMTSPWNLAWDPFWSAPTAGFVLGGVSILALGVASLCRPGRARAGVALGGLLVGMAALAGPDPTAFLYGVRPLVPPVLLAMAVGGATASRGGSEGAVARRLVWIAAFFLLAILLYPLPVPGRGGGDTHTYRSTIGGIVLALRRARNLSEGWAFLTSAYSPGLVFLSLGVLLTSLVCTRGPGRRPVVLWGLFLVTLAYPSMHTAWTIARDPLARVGGAVEEFVRRVSQDLSVYYLPHALGIAAATADLLLARRPRAATALPGNELVGGAFS